MVTCSLHEALDIFKDELPEIRKACLENATQIISKNSPYQELDIDQPVTPEAIKEHLNYIKIKQQAKPLFQTIRRIDSYRLHKQNPNPTGGITDMDIQNAREASADWFIYQAQLSTRKPHCGKCPFHADNKPSLTLMKSKQSGNLYLKCFPCGAAWDSIGFIQARDNVDFMEAVRIVIS